MPAPLPETQLDGALLVGAADRRGSGSSFDSVNPANGARIWSGAEASATDVDAVVAAAHAAFPGWRRTPLADRIALVRRFAALVESRKGDLTGLISRETGKALWDAATEAAAVIGKAELSVKAHAERTGERDLAAGPVSARLSHHPHGVMAVLGPFNFPAHLPNGHIMPALIAGNTVILKPSEQTPAVGEWMVRVWREAGAPPGVVNLVQGAREPAERLVAHPHVDGVLFTGGVETGRAIHRALAGKLEKIVALELGGNNPLIVWNAADVEAAARLIVRSAYITSGQRCTCARRLIIEDGAAGRAVTDALAALIPRLQVGRPDGEPQPFMGPVISPRAASQVLAAQDQWSRAGGRTLVSAATPEAGAAYVTPGLVDVTDANGLPDTEVFGPLLKVVRARTFESALEAANATAFGLAAGLISDEEVLFRQFAQEIRAGVVNWNRPTTGASGALPFGGVGLSGNHRPAGYHSADYCAWPMASLVAPGAARDDEPLNGLLR
jgi:succinylglutamic semialdehyde dehydrogenase